MAAGKFTLADRLGAKSVPCKVPGCSRTWIQLSNKAFGLAGGVGSADDATEGMCDPCREKFRTLKDALRPCDRKGCTGTWTWPLMAQLEAFAAKRPAPKHLCADCKNLLDSLQDKEIPCAVPGCVRTATLTREQQLVSQGEPPAESMPPSNTDGVTISGFLCEPCAQVARKLRDRAVACGIISCSRKWTWKADDQIQAFAAGKPNEPPRRMCAGCRAEFGKLLDREIRCRTSGCKSTWTWMRSDQLDACVADKPVPKAPSRMCQRCFDLWSSLKDVERPCRRSGCKGTWSDKRGAQLARLVRGKSAEPYPRYCGECEKELGDLDDREIACRTDGCPGTWTWSKEQQLAAGVRPKLKEPPPLEAAAVAPAVIPAGASDGAPVADADAAVAPVAAAAASETVPAAENSQAPTADAPAALAGRPGKGKKNRRRREPQPPERRCSACAEFLAGRKTQEIPCIQCGTPIYWPPESQLQTHLGNWAAPALCGACKLAQVTAAREAARHALRHPTLAPPPASEATPPATPEGGGSGG
jgi:hypothetical protein